MVRGADRATRAAASPVSHLVTPPLTLLWPKPAPKSPRACNEELQGRCQAHSTLGLAVPPPHSGQDLCLRRRRPPAPPRVVCTAGTTENIELAGHGGGKPQKLISHCVGLRGGWGPADPGGVGDTG